MRACDRAAERVIDMVVVVVVVVVAAVELQMNELDGLKHMNDG